MPGGEGGVQGSLPARSSSKKTQAGCVGNGLHVVPQGSRSGNVLVFIQKKGSATGLQNFSCEGVLVQATHQGWSLLRKSRINVHSLSARMPLITELAASPAAESSLRYQVETPLPTASRQLVLALARGRRRRSLPGGGRESEFKVTAGTLLLPPLSLLPGKQPQGQNRTAQRGPVQFQT